MRASKFSQRLPADLSPNSLTRLRRERASIPFDLTLSNPTLCGIRYPDGLLRGLAQPAGLAYQPHPLGLREARRAVADEQLRHGRRIHPESVVLTASTSEAYSLLFKLLCDPGQAVLFPAPSYPLFEHLASLEGVGAVAYRLERHRGWQADFASGSLRDARAVVVVHPNNPTGSYVEPGAARELSAACSRYGVPLIADEVFLDYPLLSQAPLSSFASRSDALTFTLGGLSKYVGLPQLKLAWIVVSGPPQDVAVALERLSFMADSYLSVGTPVQLALPELFVEGAAVRAAILERCKSNLACLGEAATRMGAVEVIPPGGGWNVVLRYPNVVEEEVLALELLAEEGVAVHPGYFFDFSEPGYLALSLLPEQQLFAEGVRRLLQRITARL